MTTTGWPDAWPGARRVPGWSALPVVTGGGQVAVAFGGDPGGDIEERCWPR